MGISINQPHGFGGGSNLGENEAMDKSKKFSPKVRERAVRLRLAAKATDGIILPFQGATETQ